MSKERNERQRRNKARHRANKIATRGGEFIGARLTGDHVTVWIEGRDGGGAAVAGTSMQLDAVELLIRRLTNIRARMVSDRARVPRGT